MTSDYHRLLLVFVDGVGLAPASGDNPWATVPTPGLTGLLGGPLTVEQCCLTADLLLRSIDATLGVEGLPQSATGQAALFTGVNAAEMMGRHVTGLPGPRVRGLVESRNLFQLAAQKGFRSTFANAYTQSYLDSLTAGRRRPSVTTCAMSSAGLAIRDLAGLERDQAISWDILRDRLAENLGRDLPPVTAVQAGCQLAAIAGQHQLTVYETFITDLAGHGRLGFTAAEAVSRIDGLVAGLVAERSPATTLLVTSDHGNLEDARHRRHTRNPVPLLVVGPLARCFAGVDSIVEVTPRILECLGEADQPG